MIVIISKVFIYV